MAMKLSDAEMTPLTPLCADGVLICSCDSPTLMRFPHADAVFVLEREGIMRVY